MKRIRLFSVMLITGTLFLVASCTTVNLTSWKDPSSSAQIKHVFVLAMFDKLEYSQPMENNVAAYFIAHDLKCTKSLDVMAPNQPFTEDALKAKVKSLGADAVLVFSPKGADKSVDYTPPTYAGFYRGFRGGVYAVDPGFYSESTTYHIQANLYAGTDDKMLWTGDLSTTDPASIQDAATEIAKSIYDDWVKNKIIVPLEAPAR